MADLLIKPLTGAGNTVKIQDQAGGAILTSGNSGATLADGIALGTPASGTLTGCTFNSGQVLKVACVHEYSGFETVAASANHYWTKTIIDAGTQSSNTTAPPGNATNYSLSMTAVKANPKYLINVEMTAQYSNNGSWPSHNQFATMYGKVRIDDSSSCDSGTDYSLCRTFYDARTSVGGSYEGDQHTIPLSGSGTHTHTCSAGDTVYFLLWCSMSYIGCRGYYGLTVMELEQ